MKLARPLTRYASVTARCVKRHMDSLLEPTRLYPEAAFASRKDRPRLRRINRPHLRAVSSVPPVVPCSLGITHRIFRKLCSLPPQRWIRPFRRLCNATYTSHPRRRGTKLLTGGLKA